MNASDSQTASTIEFLRSLRATRSFATTPIPAGVLADILTVARWSGSAMNQQPWHFIVIENQDTLTAIASSSSHAGHVRNARLAIAIVLANDNATDEAFDEGRVAERIMLAAHAHGVGSCIGWLRPDAASDEVKTLLGVPAELQLQTIISLGIPAAGESRPPKRDSRKPVESIISFEIMTSEG